MSSIVTIANPVPGDTFGGSSFGPLRAAVKTIGTSFCNGSAQTQERGEKKQDHPE